MRKEMVMNVSEENARESLASIEETMEKARKAVVSTYAGPFLILWGFIWVVSFVGTHYFLRWVNLIWNISNGLGVIGTAFIFWQQYRRAPITRNLSDKRLVLRTILFWPLFFAYAFVWLGIIKPNSGIELNAFLVTAVMFAYVVIGLWFDSWLMVILGLAVTGVTLIGFHVLLT
jgi:hypothetical protein